YESTQLVGRIDHDTAQTVGTTGAKRASHSPTTGSRAREISRTPPRTGRLASSARPTRSLKFRGAYCQRSTTRDEPTAGCTTTAATQASRNDGVVSSA